MGLQQTLKALADPIRREILNMLKKGQDYRNEGRISYYQLGGKILYRESDIEKMLQENYREAYMSSK